MSRMHEILAVEADKEGKFKKIVAETTKDFKDKQNLFGGFIRILEMFDEHDAEHGTEEHVALTTTVNERLDYTQKSIESYFDLLYQKEATNQLAKADIVVNGEIIAEAVPATYLLGLEKRLTDLRKMYDNIPTLQVGVEWIKDDTQREGIFKTVHPEIRFKTKKKFQHQVLVPAQFPKDGEGGQSLPAQIEKWEDTVNIGKFTKIYWSGMLTSAQKSELLERFDKLIQAVKKARQKANTQEVVKEKIASKLMNFINNK